MRSGVNLPEHDDVSQEEARNKLRVSLAHRWWSLGVVAHQVDRVVTGWREGEIKERRRGGAIQEGERTKR